MTKQGDDTQNDYLRTVTLGDLNQRLYALEEQVAALEKMIVDTYATKGPPEGGMRLG